MTILLLFIGDSRAAPRATAAAAAAAATTAAAAVAGVRLRRRSGRRRRRCRPGCCCCCWCWCWARVRAHTHTLGGRGERRESAASDQPTTPSRVPPSHMQVGTRRRDLIRIFFLLRCFKFCFLFFFFSISIFSGNRYDLFRPSLSFASSSFRAGREH